MPTQRTPMPMFHRRLILIASAMAFVMLVLSAQLVRLSVVEGAERLERAEVSLQWSTLLPTYRGSILDRRGRTLAIDRPGYAIAVPYDVITGDWEMKQAARQARRDLGAARFESMSPDACAGAALERLPRWRAVTDRLWAVIRERGGLDDADLAAKRSKIETSVEKTARRVWERQRDAEIAAYGVDRETYEFKKRPLVEQVQAHVILDPVDDETAFEFRALAVELRESAGVDEDLVEVQDARQREYPWSSARVVVDRRSLPRPLASETPLTLDVHGVADHILGSIRDVHAEDVARRPFVATGADVDLAGYRALGDRVGAFGIERAWEDTLRGARGQVRRRLDTGTELRDEPVPGRDVTLTLDIMLQARVQAILSDEIGLTRVQPYHHNGTLAADWPLNSAAVVIEVETGEILAAVSMPTWAMGRAVAEVEPLRPSIDHPELNRPFEGFYPPGSIIKPLVLVAAVTEGVHRLDEAIQCTGQYYPDSARPRCWIYREKWSFATHDALLAEDALGKSCNIFFYTLAERLGMETMSDWFARFGLGAPLDVGLRYTTVEAKGVKRIAGESGGLLLSRDAIAEMSISERRFATVAMGIGQGPGVAWTPVQAANAYATIARGGAVRDATLVTGESAAARARASGDLAIDPDAVAAALEGLRRSVTRGGTGHHISYEAGDVPDIVLERGREEEIFNAAGVTIWGKTGTAQAPMLRALDTNDDAVVDSKDEGIAGLDHAWFVGLAGPAATSRPMYAIAVVVEFGGSGGRVAGPIANQIVHALQEEGYLPGEETALARSEP